jgi:nucleoside phosphorylase
MLSLTDRRLGSYMEFMTGPWPDSQPILESERKCVVIVTALDAETKAVLRHLDSWSDDDVDQGTVFYTGKFLDWEAVVVEVGPGNIAAATLGSRAISRYKAGVALFVGVAGGVKDVALGDVVVATKVYGYESGKDSATGFSPRPDLQRSAHALEQRARAMCKRNEWRGRLDPAIERDTEPNLIVGPVAAGEKVVASTKSNTAKFLKKQYGDTLAVEMEGRGFLEAVYLHQILGTVVRGVSDKLSGKSTSDKAGWQRKAADAASAVAFDLLASLDPNRSLPIGTIVGPKLAISAYSNTVQRQVEPTRPTPPFIETRPTLNDGSFFSGGEVLARVGVKGVDEVEFSFQELPDSYLRIIPKIGFPEPIPRAQLKAAADFAPLLKLQQYGCFSQVNRLGAVAYDPGGPHPGGLAPLSWATQLFPNGELWLASNTMIVRERGQRPAWIPIPFIPALSFEQIFYDKARAAIEFAVQHLGVRFPCEIEMGLLGTMDATLAISSEDMREMRTDKVVLRQPLPNYSDDAMNAALLKFFDRVYDSTGYARPASHFDFPPGPPRMVRQ